MGRPLKDKRMFYSEDHRYVLAFCARKAQYVLRNEGCFCYTEELMTEGWWKCLRRCNTESELRKAISNCIRTMIAYGRWLHNRPTIDASSKQIDRSQDHVENTDILSHTMKNMSDRTASIGMMRYGLGLHFSTIGKRLGISGERARQLCKDFLPLARKQSFP
jgi:hypothetical protein